ncbi:MAG: hypothetical protein ABSF33_15570 [Acidimicrobiales bacterium]|jgi:hypothetical protein
MTRARDVGAIDLMIGFPSDDARAHDGYLRALTKDADSDTMELDAVPFRDHVWAAFLRSNATEVFKL